MKSKDFNALAGTLNAAANAPAPSKPPKKTPVHLGFEPQNCPHCQSTRITRRGVYNRLQRYWCKDCSKTFNAATGTPLARLRNKELLATYAQCRTQNMTLRETARTMGTSVSKAWLWSHRVDLSSITPSPA